MTWQSAGKIAATGQGVNPRSNPVRLLALEFSATLAEIEIVRLRARHLGGSRQGLDLEDLVPWLGSLEVAQEFGVHPITQAQQLDRVQGALGCTLLHLHAAGAAFR